MLPDRSQLCPTNNQTSLRLLPRKERRTNHFLLPGHIRQFTLIGKNAATAFGAALQNRKMDRVASPPKQDRHETHSPRFARQVSSDPQTARISPLEIYRQILQSPSGGPLQSQRVSDTWCRQSSAGSRDDASISRLAQYAIQFACVDCSTRSLLTIQSFEFMSPE